MNYAPTTQGWYEQQMGVPFIGSSSTNNSTTNPDGTLNSQAASRSTMTMTPPKFLDQFSDFPAWMPRDNQTTNQGQLQSYKAGIPAAFSTAGVEKAYNNQIAGMMAQGRGHAAAAGAAYGNRALQAGASGAGAGFAQAQAMLPTYDKMNAMQSDLANIRMKAKQNANQAQGSVASQMAQMAAQREGMMTDYATKQQEFALRNRQLQFEQNQSANAALAAARSRGGNGGSGGLDGAEAALRYGNNAKTYALYNNGQPMTLNDAAQYGSAQEDKRAREYAMGRLMGAIR
jgi:hypothetical protein